MIKSLAASVLTLLCLPHGALAQDPLLRIRPLLDPGVRQVKQAPSGQTAAAIVSRQGTLRITGTFVKKSKFDLPVRCFGFISVSRTFVRPTATVPAAFGTPAPDTLTQSQLATFADGIGTCTLSMDYHWPEVDEDATVNITLFLDTDVTAYFRNNDVGRPVGNIISIQQSYPFMSAPPPASDGLTVYDLGQLIL